jgi:membrane protease YdiL (CAAX protease family)
LGGEVVSDVAEQSKRTGDEPLVGADHGAGEPSSAEPADDGASALEPADDGGSALEPADDGGSALEPADDGGSALEPAPPAPRGSAGMAWLLALTVTAIGACATFFAFQPDRAGSRSILLILGGPYLLLSAVTCLWLHWRGELRQRLAPAGGDVTKGFLLAVALYGGAVLAHRLLTAKGTPREWWIIRAYVQVGDPTLASVWLVGLAVLLIAASEEVVWRGLVMGSLGSACGATRAWLLTTVLYAASYAPTVLLLRDEFAGPNPLIVGAALVGGLVWGFVAARTGRLMPMVFAHALATWAVVQYPVWRF